jgi:hypothetical protein
MLDSVDNPEAFAELCSFTVPYLEGVPFPILAKILTDESDNLSTLRATVKALVYGAQSEPERCTDLLNDIVRPATDKISRRFKTIASTHSLKIGGVAASAVALSLLSISGVAAATSATLLGTGRLTMLLAKQYAEYLKDRDDLKEMPYYLLWKLGREKQ